MFVQVPFLPPETKKTPKKDKGKVSMTSSMIFESLGADSCKRQQKVGVKPLFWSRTHASAIQQNVFELKSTQGPLKPFVVLG